VKNHINMKIWLKLPFFSCNMGYNIS